MSDFTKDGVIKKYGEEGKAALKKLSALSDADMSNVVGGVGGANEATCPQCGKSMQGGYNDGFIVNGWKCSKCGIATDMSDAETIQLIKIMEQSGIQNIGYPVWWKQVAH